MSACIQKYSIFFLLYSLVGILLSGSTKAEGVYAQSVFPEDVPSSRCTIFPPNGGEYTFSPLPASVFKLNDAVVLPPMTKNWSVQCTEPTAVTFQLQDLQSSSASNGDFTQFGLGHVNGTGKIGYYRIQLTDASVDNVVATVHSLANKSAQRVSTSRLTAAQQQIFGWSTDGLSLAEGRYFSMNVTVEPTLNSLKSTGGPLVNGATLQGNAEFVFTFGL